MTPWQRWLRTDRDEILDREGLNPRGRAILADLDRFNRIGGWYRLHCRMVTRHWEALGRPTPLRLLDVGTGPGGLLSALVEHFDGLGVPLEPLGVDLSPDYVAMAQERLGDRAPVRQADATDLPFEAGAFDVATCTLMLHHLPQEARARLVAELGRVCRSVYLFDLELTLYGTAGWGALSALLGMGADTRHDGMVSVRRGSTLAEFRDLVAPLPVRGRRVFPTALCTEPR
jgi:SAM-dependent methyltransferase